MTTTTGLARYVMIGGFLGAGKTTAIDKFARSMVERGLRVGLITNDQSTGLVDTAILRSQGHAVEDDERLIASPEPHLDTGRVSRYQVGGFKEQAERCPPANRYLVPDGT